MSKEEATIFVSHSSKDTLLIKFTELAFEHMDIKPYFAKNRIEGKNPVDKIIDAITSSKAFFALITPNVVNDLHTRDWVNFELGVARTNQIKIFIWIDKTILATKTYPRLIDNITDYNEFDFQSDDECYKVILVIRDIVENLSGRKNVLKNNLELLGQLGIMEAQTLAESFIIAQKGLNFDIEINLTEPTSDGWIIKGTASENKRINLIPYQWIVLIKGKTISSYEFKPKLSSHYTNL
ncbi:MAG: toll/interleukin-1 receptor domain-containing protein [Candidatus Bathyarchaeota archaeon]|nr:toll/interleukin-1 receptor domain-containing protein [Candidatus Bathyarchaeota archaeon]